MISEEYKKQLQELHSRESGWGTTAEWALKDVISCIENHNPKSLLDYGAGKGALSHALKDKNLDLFEYDPGIPEKSNSPEPADLVCCIDVLEHVEPDQVDNVLKDLQRVVSDKGFFLISLIPAMSILPDGRNAHILLESPQWWCSKIEKYMKVDECLVYPLVENEVFNYFDQENYPYHHMKVFVSCNN